MRAYQAQGVQMGQVTVGNFGSTQVSIMRDDEVMPKENH